MENYYVFTAKDWNLELDFYIKGFYFVCSDKWRFFMIYFLKSFWKYLFFFKGKCALSYSL